MISSEWEADCCGLHGWQAEMDWGPVVDGPWSNLVLLTCPPLV